MIELSQDQLSFIAVRVAGLSLSVELDGLHIYHHKGVAICPVCKWNPITNVAHEGLVLRALARKYSRQIESRTNKAIERLRQACGIAWLALDLDPENSPPQWSKEDAGRIIQETLYDLKGDNGMDIKKLSTIKSHELAYLMLSSENQDIYFHHKLRGKIMPEEIQVCVTAMETTKEGVVLS